MTTPVEHHGMFCFVKKMFLGEWNKTTDLVYPADCRIFTNTFHYQTNWSFVQVNQECSAANNSSLVQISNQVCYMYNTECFLGCLCLIATLQYMCIVHNVFGRNGLIQCTTWHFRHNSNLPEVWGPRHLPLHTL